MQSVKYNSISVLEKKNPFYQEPGLVGIAIKEGVLFVNISQLIATRSF